jgi:hypothetical protein
MADATSKKLVSLLEPQHPGELRRAAALILGEIGPRAGPPAEALCAAVDDSDPQVRTAALSAVGTLRIERALPRLLARVREGGVEAELAAQAAARLGAKGTHALQELMPHVAPGLRQRIAAALGAGESSSAEAAAVDALLDNDAKVVDAAARALIGKVPTLDTRHRRSLADHALALLGTKKRSPLTPHCEAALVRLLAALGDARSEASFWARLDAGRPPELRAAALQALGTLPAPTTRDRLQRLLACAADPDFRVAAPALMILKAVPVSDRTWADWLPLLEAQDVGVRRFGVEKLGTRDAPGVAAALLAQLSHPDHSMRDEALACLARLKHGRQALARALLEADTPDRAWALAKAQAPFVRAFDSTQLAPLFTQAGDFLEASDRRAEPLLFLLREADAHALRDRLEERALALRKKKEYATALVYLRLLARDPALGEQTRFELAACGLKASTKDLDAQAADPSLEQFAAILHRRAIELFASVEQARWLEADDLFYLGFHFAEGNRQEKEFGGQVLRLVVSRWPRAKVAKDARSKLRSQGLPLSDR